MRDYASFLSKKIEKGLVINQTTLKQLELPNTEKKNLNKTELQDDPEYSNSTLKPRSVSLKQIPTF